MGLILSRKKFASNSKLANKKNNWIDFSAGVVAEGENLNVTGQRLLTKL